MGLSSSAIHAAPTGGEVVAGQASIAQNQHITDIHQSSQNAAINWQQFSIGAQETVNFHQPNTQAITLNRVLGHERSVIDGAMNANGNVFIQNPNGTLIGKNAQINVGGLVATSAHISNEDLMNGNLRFTGNGNGSIENLGHITVPVGGVVALIAPIVKNHGTITAHQAHTLLASADSFSITLPDNRNFAYTLDKGTLQGLIDNGGAILADGGHVVLSAKGVDTVKKSLIKHSGIIEANTVRNVNGTIELLGDLDHSELQLTGTLKAEGKGQQNGGFIETSAAKVRIANNVNVSTRSEHGNAGTWLIDPNDFTVAPSGGDMTGIAVEQGLQGGNVVIQSTAGKAAGKGDVIINDSISWNQNKLTLNAHNDIHINKTLNGTGTAQLALEYGQGTSGGGDSNYYLDQATPLASRTVKVNLPAGKNFSTKKGSSGLTETFDVIHQMPAITQDSNGEWQSKFTTDKIAFGSDINVSHTRNHEGFAGWELRHYTGTVHGLGHVVDGLWLRSKKDHQHTGLFSYNDNEGLLRDIGVTQVDVRSEGDSSATGGLAGVGQNIHNSYATGTVSTTGEHAHAGGLAGTGHNIHNSYATGNVSTTGNHANTGGLAGAGDNIHNSYATGNVSTAGEHAHAGGLTGFGENIHNSYATGAVSTTNRGSKVGGLVGIGKNTHNSYATGTISTVGEDGDAGGLMGWGTNIHSSYATGTVSTIGHSANAGGLVGHGSGIHNSYATGAVSTTGDYAGAGGLAGHGGDVHNSYADNPVSATSSNSHQGGIVGWYIKNQPSNNSFFNQTKNPSLQAVGSYLSGVDQSQVKNLSGKTEAELKQQATFQGWDFKDVWRISEGSDTPRLRALTQGKITIGGKKLLIHGVLLSKRYNGEPILTYDELTSLDGWKKDGIVAIGLLPSDKLSDNAIFSGKITLGGNWQGAINVGDYDIIPSGLSSQKYEIEYRKGTLSILPIQLGLIGQRPYDASSVVTVDKNTQITGEILPRDQGKLTVSGSSKIIKQLPTHFEYAKDVGTYRLLGGNLTVSDKNYVINPAISQWTITPKTIYLTGNAKADDKMVTASQVNLNQLGIEAVDRGKVGLIGQGTLNSNNKLASGHSFKLTGSEAGNYRLDASKAWVVSSNTTPITPPTNPITPPNTGDQQYAKDLIDEARKVRNLAGKDYIIAKSQGKFIDVASLNRDIAIAKQKARIAINKIKTANIRNALLKQVDAITQLPALDWALSGGGSNGGHNTYVPPSVPNISPSVPNTPNPSVVSLSNNDSTQKPPTVGMAATEIVQSQIKIQMESKGSISESTIISRDSDNKTSEHSDSDYFVTKKAVLPALESVVDEVVLNEIINNFGFFVSTIKSHDKLVAFFGPDLIDGSEKMRVNFMRRFSKKLMDRKPEFGNSFTKEVLISIVADIIIDDLKNNFENMDDPFLKGIYEGSLDIAKILILECLNLDVKNMRSAKATVMELKVKLLAQMSIYAAKQTVRLGIESINFDKQVKSLIVDEYQKIGKAAEFLNKAEVFNIIGDEKYKNLALSNYETTINNNHFLTNNLGFDKEKIREINSELAKILYLYENNQTSEAIYKLNNLQGLYPPSAFNYDIPVVGKIMDTTETIISGGLATLFSIFDSKNKDKYMDITSQQSFRNHANIFNYGDYIDSVVKLYINENIKN